MTLSTVSSTCLGHPESQSSFWGVSSTGKVNTSAAFPSLTVALSSLDRLSPLPGAADYLQETGVTLCVRMLDQQMALLPGPLLQGEGCTLSPGAGTMLSKQMGTLEC